MNRKLTLALPAALLLVMAFIWIGSGRALIASMLNSGAIPEMMTYQGTLSNAAGPYTGSTSMTFAIYDAESAGNKVWEESHVSVPVGEGFFSVVLGSQGQPLGASVFGGIERWLQVNVDLGQGMVTLPRQRFHAVPYALRAYAAETAQTAASAQTANSATTAASAMTAITATYAITALNASASTPLQNVVTVARSGGDFTSVQAALDSIATASATNPYLVYVAPGLYDESGLVRVPGYVHLQGAGANATVIRSTRSSAGPASTAAAVELLDNGRISDLRIENNGTSSAYTIGLYSQGPAGRATVVENVEIAVTGTGGTAHFGVFLNDAEPTLHNSSVTAAGANAGTSINAALGSINVAGGFPQALIENSTLTGIGSNSGYGMFLSNSAPNVRFSTIAGDFRGIAATINGTARVEGASLSVGGFAGSFLFETGNSAAVLVAGSQVQYAGNKHTGTGGLVCVHSYKSNFTAASNGSTPGTACN